MPLLKYITSVLLMAVFVSACASKSLEKKESSSHVKNVNLSKNLSGSSAAAACITGLKALDHIKNIIAFGPRHPGTEGIKKTRNYIVKSLKEMGLHPELQQFTAYTPHPQLKTVNLANIIVDIPSESKKNGKTVIVSGHFDGKIIKSGFFAGANDGGSSTGLLLEMAECLKKHPSEARVKLVFLTEKRLL
jgi:hypothetical protein